MKKKSTMRTGAKVTSQTLSDDVLTDLKHVIELAKSKSADKIIGRAEFRNIVHNFGYYSIRQKEFEELLSKNSMDPKKASYTEGEVISLVTSLW